MVNRGIAILIKPRIRLCIAFLVHRQELHHAIGTLAHGSNKRSKWSSSNRGWESIFEYFFRYSGGMKIPVYWLVTGPWPHRCYLKRFVKSKPSCPETQVPNSSDWSQLKFPIDVQTPPVWKKKTQFQGVEFKLSIQKIIDVLRYWWSYFKSINRMFCWFLLVYTCHKTSQNLEVVGVRDILYITI